MFPHRAHDREHDGDRSHHDQGLDEEADPDHVGDAEGRRPAMAVQHPRHRDRPADQKPPDEQQWQDTVDEDLPGARGLPIPSWWMVAAKAAASVVNASGRPPVMPRSIAPSERRPRSSMEVPAAPIWPHRSRVPAAPMT